MQLDPFCIECQIRRQRLTAEKMGNPAATKAYLTDCLRILADAPDDIAAPWLAPRFYEAWVRYFPDMDRYADNKRDSNAYALSREAALRARIEGAEDPLYTAVTLARVGNYLDFAALGDSVSFDTLDALTEQALADQVDPEEFEQFKADLAGAKKLLLLTDNAGEIVYDKLLLEQLAKDYPQLELVTAVRGGNALNDATRADAIEVGIDSVSRLIDSGAAVPGTQLSDCSEAFLSEFRSADVILSKGQGNFETLWGCGANIYYLFLCKCELFVKLFSVPKLTGMFVNERRISIKK